MKLSRLVTYFLGVGTGIILCLLVTFEQTGEFMEGADSSPGTRSTQSVIWIPDSAVEERAIHAAMGLPISDVLAIAGVQNRDAIDRLPKRRVDASTIDHGRMNVECNRLYAVKCRGTDDVIVFGEVFGHMPGYSKFPGTPFVDEAE